MINLVFKKRIKLNTLVIVSTQFQLFNAIEVSRNFFKDKKFNIIVLVQNRVHFQQINNLAKNHDLKVIFSVKFRPIIQYIDLIIKLFRFNKKYEILEIEKKKELGLVRRTIKGLFN